MAFLSVDSFYGSATGSTATATPTSTLPTDRIVLVGINANDAGVIAANADAGGGWVELADFTPTSETGQMAFYYKITNGTEPASYTFDLGSSRGHSIALKAFSYSGSAPVIDAAVNTDRENVGAATLLGTAYIGQVVSDNALGIIFVGKDNVNSPSEDYTTADQSYVGIIGNTNSNRISAMAHRIYTTGETGAAAIIIQTADGDDDRADFCYSCHISFVEAAGDTTAPVLSSPTASSITTDGVTPQVTTDEGNGTAYARVYADGDTPTASQVQAGTGGGTVIASATNLTVSATGVLTFSGITGLTDGTNYELAFAHVDSATNLSVVSIVGFTTLTDSTAPVLTSGAANSIGLTVVTPAVTTDTAEGTAYARVYADGDTPTASQVQAGTGGTVIASSANLAVSATGALNFSEITGLIQNTAYTLKIVHVDAATSPNLSAVTTINFRTASTVTINVTDAAGNTLNNLTGLSWAWYDGSFWSSNRVPIDVGTGETTDGSGNVVLQTTNSIIASNTRIWVMLFDATGNKLGLYYPLVD